MKSKYKIFFAFMILSLLVLNLGSSFMPRTTHKYIHIKGTENPIDSELYRKCMAYPRLCYSGNVLTDISVVYYYVDPDKYIATHSPVFFRRLWENSKNEEEKACAVGAIVHQGSDIPSHNNMVPYAIRNSFLVNEIVHVFAEQKIDSWVESQFPLIKGEAMNDLGDYEKCKDLFIRTMHGDPRYGGMSVQELDDLYVFFINEIKNSQKTGYDSAFKNKSLFVSIKSIPTQVLVVYLSWLFFLLIVSVLILIKIFKKKALVRHYIALIFFLPLFIIFAYFLISLFYGSAFNNFINFITPISQLVPVGDIQMSLDQAINQVKLFLTKGELALEGTDASGFEELAKANASVKTADYIIMVISGILLIFYIWYLLKKNKIMEEKVYL